jgi:hypothetical protein
MNPKDKATLDRIVDKIKDFTTDLASDDAAQSATSDDYLREQLELLFDLLCDLNQFKRKYKVGRTKYLETDAAILSAWRTALSAIEALSSWVRDGTRGHFIAARMLLFLMHAFTHCDLLPADMDQSKLSRQRVKLQMSFIHRLDETMLTHLRAVWDASGQKDTLSWATTHMACSKDSGETDGHGIRVDFNRAAVRALSAKELWDIPGMSGAKRWAAVKGDQPIYEKFPDATSVTYGTKPKKNGQPPILAQTLFSDGPLRAEEQFCLFKGDDEEWLRGPRLARSLQFVLDVRRSLHPWLVAERQRLAGHVGELPPELRGMVADELRADEEGEVHPYLSRFDLSKVYAPFPEWETEERKCEECGEDAGKGTDMKVLTCPAASIYIWNRGLRAFHTFHRKAKKGVTMCMHGTACTGHHEDDTHEIKNLTALREILEDIVKSRCGPNATLESAGLSGKPWLRDHVQRNGGGPAPAEIKRHGLDWPDVEAEIRMTGGWLALDEAMREDKMQVPCFEEDGTCEATTEVKALWSWSRDEDDEDLCKKHLKGLSMH